MKIAFVYPSFESIGIEYLSAALKKKGHKTKLVFDPCLFDDAYWKNNLLKKVFSFKKYVNMEIIDFSPDLVAFSVVTDRYLWACESAARLKSVYEDIPIVFGGIHPTSVPERVIKEDFIDFVITGEAEKSIVELADCIEKGRSKQKVSNLWYKKNGKIVRNKTNSLIEDLDSLPFPDKDLYKGELNQIGGCYNIITSRGCPFNCSFCNNNVLRKLYENKGKYRRRRSVQNVIQELKQAKNKYKINQVNFFDEEFFLEKDWIRDFLPIYREEINIPYFCYINSELIDKDSLDLLQNTGCISVALGVETLNSTLNKEVLNKKFSLEKVDKVITVLKNTSINLIVFLMFGIPGQTEEDLIEQIKYFNVNKVDEIRTFWLRCYPKTDILNIVKEKKLLKTDKAELIGKGESSFYLGGDTYNADFARIIQVYNLINFLPKKIINFIIKNKIYRLFPQRNFKNKIIFLMILKHNIESFFGKKSNYTFLFQKRYFFYLHYMVKKIKREITKKIL
jgi:radical SAM superfamily enzyme YgiQ (UPF0313 family)